MLIVCRLRSSAFDLNINLSKKRTYSGSDDKANYSNQERSSHVPELFAHLERVREVSLDISKLDPGVGEEAWKESSASPREVAS